MLDRAKETFELHYACSMFVLHAVCHVNFKSCSTFIADLEARLLLLQGTHLSRADDKSRPDELRANVS
jgi:hypothetical protein